MSFSSLRLGDVEIGLVLVDHRLIRARIDLGADLALLHLRVVVAVQLLDHAGDIGADDDGEHRIDRAGRRHGRASPRRGVTGAVV